MGYNETDIFKIVKKVIDISKTHRSSLTMNLLSTNTNKYPEYFSGYKDSCEMRDRIMNHAEPSRFPETLFRVKAPRMDKEEFDYVKGNFKQTTLPVYMDYLSTINRIFNDTSWSIEYKDSQNDANMKEYMDYCEKGIVGYGSIETFTRQYLPHPKLTDAGGCIVIKPNNLSFIDTEQVNNNGERIKKLDNSNRLKPQQYYYSCDQLVAYSENNYFLFETDVIDGEYNNKKADKSRLFEFYDKENIYSIKQTGFGNDIKIEITLLISHNWGRIPVEFLKGIPKITKSGVQWISPFYYAVDLLDLMLLNETNLQLSINSCVFPHKIFLGDECQFKWEDKNGNIVQCNDGSIFDISGNRSFTCPSCNGSGVKSKMSPLGVMIIKANNEMTGEKTSSPMQSPIMFVSPEVTPLEFIQRKIENYEMRARKILHLSTTSSEVTTTDQKFATGMMLDLKALYAYISNISAQIFDLMRFQYEAFAMYMFGVDEYKRYVPTIIDPVSYDFKTEGDYLKEISDATESNLPPYIIHTIIYRYIKAMYFNDPNIAEIFMLIISTDSFLIYSSQQIQEKMNTGLIEDWQVILHECGLSIINQLMSENKDFFNNDIVNFEQRKELLIERAKQMAASSLEESAKKRQALSDGMAQSIYRATNQMDVN